MTESHLFVDLLATLVAIILATKLLGALAQRLGQPSVLGELLAGVVLGGSVLGVIDPHSPVIFALAELGVLILLFEIGLHTELASLVRVGVAATSVGLVGVILPFAGGFAVSVMLGLDTLRLSEGKMPQLPRLRVGIGGRRDGAHTEREPRRL